jgi:hypothetical protein
VLGNITVITIAVYVQKYENSMYMIAFVVDIKHIHQLLLKLIFYHFIVIGMDEK